ncbi:MAG: hypothetical protein KO206_07090 [Methanomicrobiaceae archaeon]|nr:hypothetical protein [Methanomicrobiaceae archaeon]MDD5418781.1 hypothetical protein [Methanomicrobiaceae archaeon]
MISPPGFGPKIAAQKDPGHRGQVTTLASRFAASSPDAGLAAATYDPCPFQKREALSLPAGRF